VRRVLYLLTALLALFASGAIAIGGYPTAGGYVLYAQIPVVNWNNLAVAFCKKNEPWASCQNTLVDHSEAGITFSGPLTISSGGTYTGDFHSLSSGTPVITIGSGVSTPVLITGCILDGPGIIIKNNGTGSVEVSDNRAWGTSSNPQNFYVAAGTGTYNNLHDNVYSNTSGIYFNQTNGTTIVSVNANIGVNHNGSGAVHAVQFNGGTFAGSSITNNAFIDAPYASNVNDVINLYQAVGTSGSPITVSGNLILGAYPLDPALNGYSGGGIIVDGSSGDTALNTSQYINVTGNVVLDTTNYGVAIAAGNNITDSGNTVVSSGVVGGSLPVFAQNVGAYVWNEYGQSGSVFFGNNIESNQLYWFKATNLTINNAFFPNCNVCSGNVVLSSANTIATALPVDAFYVQKYFGSY
jgi:hypothetical protein